MNVRDLLRLLKGVKPDGRDRKTGEPKWRALCPAHDDHRASLSVGIGDRVKGCIVLTCHAGCTPDAICKKLGIRKRDLFPTNGAAARPRPSPRARIECTYPYHDADGELLFEVVRYKPKDFRLRRPNGNGGWIWNLDGTRRVLYRLPELLAADSEAVVFLPEGEKDVESLRTLGLTATCNSEGAGKRRKLLMLRAIAKPYEGEALCPVSWAKRWLAAVLATDRPAEDVANWAARAGFSARTLRRAQCQIGVAHERRGFGRGAHWLWSLPRAPIGGQTKVAMYGERAKNP